MPAVGGVFIRDDLMPRMTAPEVERPGYGTLLADAASDTVNQVRYGVPYALRRATGNITAEQEQAYQQNLGQTRGAAPASLDDVTSGRVGVGRFVGENLIGSLPYMVGGLVGGAAGFAAARNPAGAIAGAVAGGVPQFVGSNVDRAVAEQGGLSEQAATRALAVAPFQSAADAAIARFLPGAGHVLGDAAATQAGGFLRRTATAVAKAGATEAVTEAAQQVGERYVAGLPISNADAVGEYINAAVTAFAVGGVLGAGGGFRRTPAVAKPADMVTPQDMDAHIDSVLNGDIRALPSPQMFGREPQGPQIEADASAPIAMENPTDFIVDSEGRITPPGFANEQAMAIDRNQPIPSASEPGAPDISGIVPPQAPLQTPLTASTTLGRGLGVVEGFEPLPAATGSTASVAPASDEILSRVQAAQAADAQQFADFLTEQKKGLRGGFVQQVQANNEMDLLGKVYDQVFTEQDTRANTTKFAQRLGILDENLQPTELAKYIEEQRTAATTDTAAVEAPTSPAEAVVSTPRPQDASAPQPTLTPRNPITIPPEVEAEMAAARKAAGIQRVTSAKGLDTPADVFRALAVDASEAQLSQVEKLARKLGLVTDDDAMDVTPKGRQVHLTTGDGLAHIVEAAQAQGYTGKQASTFERGVQAVVAGRTPETFDSFEDMAAYQAGQVWAQDFVDNGDGTRTAAQTNAIRSRQAARTTGVAVDRRVEAERRMLTPDQVRVRGINRLLDAADTRNIDDSSIAELFRMARSGATAVEVGQALSRAQAGQSLFVQPESVDTFAPTQVARGQPIFREMNTADQAPGKAVMRAESANALETKKRALRYEIDAAYQSGDISPRARIGLIARLVANDFPGVADRLPGGPLAEKMDMSRRNFLAGVAASAVASLDPTQAAVPTLTRTGPSAELARLLRAGDLLGTLNHIATNSTNPGYRVIARMLAAGGGWDKVTLAVDDGSAGLAIEASGLLGETRLHESGVSGITLYGREGQFEETILHEAIHAYVQQRWAGIQYYTPHNKRVLKDTVDRHDAVIKQFQDLWKTIGTALKATNPELIDTESWAANFYESPGEALSWLMTNAQAQAYLKTIDETGAKVSEDKSVWAQFVDWIASLFGLRGNVPRTALDQLLDAGHAILAAGKDVRTDDFSRRFAEAARAGSEEMRVAPGARTAEATNDASKAAAAAISQVTDRIDVAELGAKTRRAVLGWLSHNQIDRQYGRVMPGLLQHSDAHRERIAVRSRFEQMGDEAYQQFEKLERENATAAEWVGQLMALSTEFQIDPAKPWDEHKHLVNDKNAPRLRQLYVQAVELANKMRRGDGTAMKVFNEFRALNEAQNYARMAAGLHGLIAMDPELTLGVADADINPVDQFMREEGLTTAAAIRDRWNELLHKQIAGAVKFINDKKGEAAQGTAADISAMQQHLSPIELQISAIHEAMAGMQKAPYFHLGRFGDYFGSAVVRKVNGQADPAALQHIAEVLEQNGFSDVQISTDNTRPKIALRFDTLDQAKRFQKLTQDLQKQGWLDKAEEIKVGPRGRGDNFGVADGLPDFVQRYIQAIEASPVYVPDEGMNAQERAALEKSRQDAVRLAVDTWLEQQPDSSISKVLVKRYTVPGYNKDMIRNFAHRWRVGSISIANVAAAPKFNQAFINMRSQVNQAMTEDVGQATKLNDIMIEMKTRDSSNPINETADTFDKARAFAHAYFLGMSPAYGLVNMTQLGVTALPELAKTHGYSKSFHAMRRASATAFKILKAATSEAIALGPKHWADMAITENILVKAGLSATERNFAMHMLATGTIDIGSAARALGQIAENRVGSKTDIALKYASAMGMYTETFSRLTTALAARELHGDKPGAEQYATNVVSNSMFDYQSWNTGRKLGKQGFAGPVTPLLTQFMSYSIQLTEKLYSEALDAFQRARPGESVAAAKERKAAARRFIAGHLVAVTSLAGTLGLPFATVFATVIERMVDKLGDDDEPFDATAAWRGFLTDVLGKDIGEVVARGLPRALGADLSSRAGEQNLLPFSEFLADRRPWKEAIEANAGRSLGAVPSMISNIITGGGKIADGDLVGGMKDVLPVAFKGPLEFYRMTDQGYVDTKGNKLPLTPSASSYLWQLLGFSPSAKAEYQEARTDQQARRGEITRRAEMLRKQIVQALIAGDQARAAELIREAQAFDADNPAFAVVPSLQGAVSRRVQAQARAKALNTPLGVSMRDIAGQELTRYANTQ